MRIALAVLLASTVGAGASDVSVAQQFGLFGRWAHDCSRPPSAGNGYSIYTQGADGTITRALRIKPSQDDYLSKVLNLVPADGSKLAMRWEPASGKYPMAIVMLMDGKRMRTWSVASESGATPIADGLLAHSDRESPWFTRCDAAP